jgi:hypothetical protein
MLTLENGCRNCCSKLLSIIERGCRGDFYLWFGCHFFVFILILQVIFFRETTINYDYSAELTSLINGGNLMDFRLGVYPWRIFAIYGESLSISLNNIFLYTSILFGFLKFMSWYLCHVILKNPAAGLFVILTTVCGITEGYYVQGFQGYNATSYVAIFFALFTSFKFEQHSTISFVILTIICVLVQNTYIVMYALCITLVVWKVFGTKFSDWRFIGFLLFLVGYVLLYYLPSTLLGAGYEKEEIANIVERFKNGSWTEFHAVVYYIISRFLELNYAIVIISSLIVVIHAIFKKHYDFVLSYLLGGLTLILFISVVIYGKTNCVDFEIIGVTFNYYIENAMYVFVCYVLIGVVYRLHTQLINIINKLSFKIILLIVIVYYSVGVVKSGLKYHKDNRYIEALLFNLNHDFEENIFVIHQNFIEQYYKNKQGLVLDETALLTAIKDINNSAAIFLTTEDSIFFDEMDYPYFITELRCSNKGSSVKSREPFFHFKFYPNEFFMDYSTKYFKFSEPRYRIVDEEYLKSFHSTYYE